MGTFYAKCKIENPVDRTRSVVLQKFLVDTGSEFTWVPEKSLERIGIRREKKDVSFVLANGEQVTRSVGFAIIRLDKHFTIDEVVFAEPGDLMLLGARTLEGLNLYHRPRPATACGCWATSRSVADESPSNLGAAPAAQEAARGRAPSLDHGIAQTKINGFELPSP